MESTMPKPISKPPRAEEVLAAVASRYPSGSTVTLSMVAGADGINEATAVKVRRRARSAGRWPYVDSKGARPEVVRPIGPSRLSGMGWS
jgi:hypothetical protein